MRSAPHFTWPRSRTLRTSKPAAVEEAAAHAEIQQEDTIIKASPGTLRPRIVKNGSLEQPHVEGGQGSYDYAITDFVEWYCSEPRFAFDRTVVLRHRIYLEQKRYAPTTINLRLAAVRRVAYEADDPGLLSQGGRRCVEGGQRHHRRHSLSIDQQGW